MDQNSISLSLVKACSNDALEVLNWFTSEKQIKDWGGPAMYYPISVAKFLSTLNLTESSSFKLVQQGKANETLAFGQFYVRLGRHHLARLAVSPNSRGQGIGRHLVNGLIKKAHLSQTAKGDSLYVMHDNPVAISLYQSLGFTFAEYPDSLPKGLDDYLYMVRDQFS